jgi:hypothetical protein
MIIRLDINRSTPGLVFSGVMPTSVAKFILCEKESGVVSTGVRRSSFFGWLKKRVKKDISERKRRGEGGRKGQK